MIFQGFINKSCSGFNDDDDDGSTEKYTYLNQSRMTFFFCIFLISKPRLFQEKNIHIYVRERVRQYGNSYRIHVKSH